MWIELQIYVIPKSMINLIKSFHEGMISKLKIDGEKLGGQTNVSNELFFNLAIVHVISINSYSYCQPLTADFKDQVCVCACVCMCVCVCMCLCVCTHTSGCACVLGVLTSSYKF